MSTCLRVLDTRRDESVDRLGQIGPCKNVAAYRTVLLADAEGQHAMRALGQVVKHDGLLFRSRRGGPLVENTILVQGLHPAVKQLGLPKSGMHGFRRDCNRRWELARVSSAVIRQQMGHATASMTAHYTGEIPAELVVKQLHGIGSPLQLERPRLQVVDLVGAGDGNRTNPIGQNKGVTARFLVQLESNGVSIGGLADYTQDKRSAGDHQSAASQSASNKTSSPSRAKH